MIDNDKKVVVREEDKKTQQVIYVKRPYKVNKEKK